MRFALMALVLLFAADLRAQDAAPPDTIDVDWTTTLVGIQVERRMPVGTAFVVDCPPGGSVSGTIWGTGTYTSDSPLCMAAVHVGLLTATAGGAVVVEVAPGLPSYAGTIRNGIASSPYPAWDASYRFPDAPEEPEGPVVHEFQGDWSSQAAHVTAPVGAVVRMNCPAGGRGGSVWGTGIYTSDSSICEAAVHAGVIERVKGGVVRFEILGPQTSFAGSERNGVATASYGPWSGSFRLLRPDE